MHMRRRIHAYEEEDTCIWGGGYMHMRRRIHAYTVIVPGAALAPPVLRCRAWTH
jgi:hypothetical protein